VDLGRCPKCGDSWARGAEKCRKCGYTAIGAGLAKLPKRKRIPAPKYEEPGAWTPFLAFTFGFLALAYTAYAQPWKDGFTKLKAQLGITSEPGIVGEWEVSRIIYPPTPESTMGIREETIKGLFSFAKNETFKANILVRPSPVKAEGKYKLLAGKLAVRSVSAMPSNSFPTDVDCTVNFVTEDQVVATFPNSTALFMNRTRGIENAAKVMGYKISGEAMKRVPEDEP